MELLRFLFSPQGTVGRGSWWLTQIVWYAVAFLIGFHIYSTMDPLAKQRLASADQTPPGQWEHLTPVEREAATDRIMPEVGKILAHQSVALQVFILLLLWVPAVIEIKRWHDLGLTGFCYLIRYLPIPLMYYHPDWASRLAELTPVFLMVMLGLRKQSTQISLAFTDPDSFFGRLGFAVSLLGFTSLAFLIFALKNPDQVSQFSSQGFVQQVESWPAEIKSQKIPLLSALIPGPETQTEPPAPSTPGNGSPNNGYEVPAFDKSWVVVDGIKMAGITQVLPARDGQVTIIYSQGTRNVPAASLPQGFLDGWNLTPDRLKAADGK